MSDLFGNEVRVYVSLSRQLLDGAFNTYLKAGSHILLDRIYVYEQYPLLMTFLSL